MLELNEVLDGIGMIGFALAGLLATQGRRMDPVGVFVATFTTAFGGGIVRDIMLDLRPFYWASHPQWVWFAIFLTLFAPVIIRRMRVRWRNALYVIADAVGLAFFSISSTITALATGANATTSVIIGVTTGVFGGLLRDVFLNRTPAVLSDRTPYATAAFIGCTLYALGAKLVYDPALLSPFCGSLIFFIRVSTYFQRLQLVSYRWLRRLVQPIRFPHFPGIVWDTEPNNSAGSGAPAARQEHANRSGKKRRPARVLTPSAPPPTPSSTASTTRPRSHDEAMVESPRAPESTSRTSDLRALKSYQRAHYRVPRQHNASSRHRNHTRR